MNQEEAEGKVVTLAAYVLFFIVAALYLIPWVLPLHEDFPEGFAMPYYGVLLAIEMSRNAVIRGSSGADD